MMAQIPADTKDSVLEDMNMIMGEAVLDKPRQSLLGKIFELKSKHEQ